MGHKNCKQNNKNVINNDENQNFKEQKLFESFQEKKLSFEITAITYFKFNLEDIIINEEKDSSLEQMIENNIKVEKNKSNSKKKKKIKKEIYLDKNTIESKIFLFLYNIDNSLYAIDSHSFEKLFKFREESKENKEKCKIMFQSEHQKSTLICIHENRLNVNKIKIINSLNKSSIYCDQIQSILFGEDYISIYDIMQLNLDKLIIGLEGCLFVWDKTNNPEEINMSKSKERKIYEKILNDNNFPEEHKGYNIQNKGEHHYILSKAFNLKDFNDNKKLIIDRISIKNILKLNNSLFVILININNSSSILRFYFINKNDINLCDNKDIIIKDFKYKNYNISKIFYITDKYFGFINIENINIISSKFKEIVSIYLINDIHSLNNINLNNHIKIFLPSCFIIFEDHYILVQFIDLINKNIYLKIFKFIITNSNEFIEIFNASKKRIKNEDLIYNILEFKNVKDSNFSAKFFITNNKNNMIKKWIFTNYEKC